jgi:hypothetical protein
MATGTDVMMMLIPTGGWAIEGDDYENIQFIEATPITKKQFEDGFKTVDAWKAEKDAEIVAAKQAAQAKLAALGLTTDDLKALGLGNN